MKGADYDSAWEPVLSAETGWQFDGWDPTITVVNQNETLYAQFSKIPEMWATVAFAADANGAINDGETTEREVLKGTVYDAAWQPAVTPDTGYQFDVWTNVPEQIDGDVTVTATFKLKTFSVIFKKGNEAVWTETVNYGSQPAGPDAAPEEDSTSQYEYTFIGWTDQNNAFVAKDENFPSVTSDMTYTAVFEQSVRTYPVTWNNWDGTLLKTDPAVEYGKTPSYDGAAPEKAADPYQYVFAGWTPDVAPVAGPQTYTAVFTTQPAKISYVTDGDHGTVSGDMTIVRTVGEDYQTDWRPDVTPDAGWTCTFVGEPDVITGDVTVTIRFEKAPDMWVTVTYYSDGNGFLFGTNEREVLKGTEYDVRWRPVPGPFPGYRFSEWENEPEGAVNSNVVITARFVKETADGSQISFFEKLIRTIQEFFMRIVAMFSHSGSTCGSSGGSYGSGSASGGSSGGSYGSTGA